MEKLQKTEKKPEQVTFKDPEIYSALKALAEEDGTGQVGPKAKELLKIVLTNEPVSIEKKSSTKEQSQTSEGDPVISNKIDMLIGTIAELILELKEKNHEVKDLISAEELESAVREKEENLRDNNLVLRLSPSQKLIFLKVLEHRKDRGKEHSESIEDLFFYMSYKMFYQQNWWESSFDGFDEEFKEAFLEYFDK